jgi:peroxin-16
MAAALRELLEKYRKFVIDNVETIGHVESSARILSYIAPGGTATSSEFLSAVVSLVVLVNDSILRSAASMPLNFADAEKKMAFCLTVIEYVEVFLEMAAYGQNRNVARWLVVVGVQIVKAVLRFLLLLKYNVGIVASSPVPALRRGKELMMRIRENHGTTPSSSHQVETTTTAAAAS